MAKKESTDNRKNKGMSKQQRDEAKLKAKTKGGVSKGLGGTKAVATGVFEAVTDTKPVIVLKDAYKASKKKVKGFRKGAAEKAPEIKAAVKEKKADLTRAATEKAGDVKAKATGKPKPYQPLGEGTSIQGKPDAPVRPDVTKAASPAAKRAAKKAKSKKITNRTLGRNAAGKKTRVKKVKLGPAERGAQRPGDQARSYNARVDAEAAAAKADKRTAGKASRADYRNTLNDADTAETKANRAEVKANRAEAKAAAKAARPGIIKNTLSLPKQAFKATPAGLAAAAVPAVVNYGVDAADRGFGPATSTAIDSAATGVAGIPAAIGDYARSAYNDPGRIPGDLADMAVGTADMAFNAPGYVMDAAGAFGETIGTNKDIGDEYAKRRELSEAVLTDPFSRFFGAVGDAYGDNPAQPAQPAPPQQPVAPTPGAPPPAAPVPAGGATAPGTNQPIPRTLATPNNTVVPAAGTGFFRSNRDGDAVLNQYSDAPEYATGNAFEGASGSGNVVQLGTPATDVGPPTGQEAQGLKAAARDRTFVTAEDLAARDGITLGDNPVDNMKTRPYYRNKARDLNAITQQETENAQVSDNTNAYSARTGAGNMKNSIAARKLQSDLEERNTERVRQLESDERAAGIAAIKDFDEYASLVTQSGTWTDAGEEATSKAKARLDKAFSQSRNSNYNRTNADSIMAGLVVSNAIEPLLDQGMMDTIYNVIAEDEYAFKNMLDSNGTVDPGAIFLGNIVPSPDDQGGNVGMLDLGLGDGMSPQFRLEEIADPRVRQHVRDTMMRNKKRNQRALNNAK